MRSAKTYDYFDHRIRLDPVRPGLWRYRVYQLVYNKDGPARETVLVVDTTTATRWNAHMRARDAARRRRQRSSRWPRLGL